MIPVRSLALSLVAVVITVQANAQQGTTIGRIERLDPAFDALVPRDARIEKLAEGFAWTEGPVWRKSGGYLLFSDIPNNTINRWKEGQGITVFLRPAGYNGSTPAGRELGTNGLAFDSQDKLVMADHGNRQIARLNDANFTRTTLADRYDGKRLNSPNDLVFHSNGDIYFTDPPYGLDGTDKSPARELPFHGIYRLKPSGELTLLTKDIAFPNGIGISPDGRTLYIGSSNGAKTRWHAFDIQQDGTLARERVFFDPAALVAERRVGGADGLKVDRSGNLWATGPGGVLVFSPDGRHLGTIMTGQPTANVAFGDDGSTLYMTANKTLMRIRTSTKGLGF